MQSNKKTTFHTFQSNILYPNRKDAHNNVARIAYEYFKLNNGHDPDHLEDFLAGRPIVISESYFDKKICGVEEEEEESDGDSLVEEDIGNGDDDAANQDGSSSPAAASSEDEDGDGYIPLDGHESVVAAPAATTDDDENEEGAGKQESTCDCTLVISKSIFSSTVLSPVSSHFIHLPSKSIHLFILQSQKEKRIISFIQTP